MRGGVVSGAEASAPVVAGRLSECDLLRATSIIGVVLIHATSPFLADMVANGGAGSKRFAFLLAINQAARFSVPAFFLLAGFFTVLAGSRAFAAPGGARTYLLNRLGRLLLPYLTWSVAFLVLPRWLHHELDPADLLTRFALGWTFTGGYFLIVLAQLSLLAPAAVRFAARRPAAARLTCLLLAAGSGGLQALAAHGNGRAALYLRDHFSALLSLFPVWAAFFLAGVLLALDRDRLMPVLRRHRLSLLALGALALAASFEDCRRAVAAGASLGIAASFLKPASIAFAGAACAGLLALGGAPGRVLGRTGDALRGLASGSYAIYLTHGGLILAVAGIALPAWQAILSTPAGPFLLAIPAIALPLALHRLASRRLPGWARFALFG